MNDFLSPFEELVLTALRKAGQGSDDREILSKAAELAGGPIPFSRVTAALNMLEAEGCVYSWTRESRDSGENNRRYYRMHFRGHQALEAAVERNANEVAADIQETDPSAVAVRWTVLAWVLTGSYYLVGFALAAGYVYLLWQIIPSSDPDFRRAAWAFECGILLFLGLWLSAWPRFKPKGTASTRPSMGEPSSSRGR
jgi:hypothetical protein